MKFYIPSIAASLLLLSLLLLCSGTPIPQQNGLVPRLEPSALPKPTSAPLSTWDDTRILTRDESDAGSDGNGSNSHVNRPRKKLKTSRPQLPPKPENTDLTPFEREKSRNLYRTLSDKCLDDQLPWNKEETAPGSWPTDTLRFFAPYVYLRRFYGEKESRKMDQPVQGGYAWTTTANKYKKVKEELRGSDRERLRKEMNLLWPWIKDHPPKSTPQDDLSSDEKAEGRELFDYIIPGWPDDKLPWNKEVTNGGWSNDQLWIFISYVYFRRYNGDRLPLQRDKPIKDYGWVATQAQYKQVKAELRDADRDQLEERLNLLWPWIKEHVPGPKADLTSKELALCKKLFDLQIISGWADDELPWNKEVTKGGWSNDRLRIFIPYIYLRRYQNDEQMQNESQKVYGWATSEFQYKEVKKELRDVDDRDQLKERLNLLWPWIKEHVPGPKADLISKTLLVQCKKLFYSISEWADDELPWNEDVTKGGWSNDQLRIFIPYIYLRRYQNDQQMQKGPQKVYGWTTSEVQYEEVKEELRDVDDRVRLQERMNLLWPWIKDHVPKTDPKDLTSKERAQCKRLYEKKINSEWADNQLPWNKKDTEGGWSNAQMRTFIRYVHSRRYNRDRYLRQQHKLPVNQYSWDTTSYQHRQLKEELEKFDRDKLQEKMNQLWPWIRDDKARSLQSGHDKDEG